MARSFGLDEIQVQNNILRRRFTHIHTIAIVEYIYIQAWLALRRFISLL